MKEELLKGLSKEQISKIRACKSQEEILALAKREGIELSDEQLAAVSGGACSTNERKCPMCGSTEFESKIIKKGMSDIGATGFKCKKCGHYWTEVV